MSTPMRWHSSANECPHYNEHACPTCDFDRYYASNYPDCPWRVEHCDACLRPLPHNAAEARACPRGDVA